MFRRFQEGLLSWQRGDSPLRVRCQSSWVPARRRVAEGRRGSGKWMLGRGQTPTGALQRTGQRGGWENGKERKGVGSRGGEWRCPWRLSECRGSAGWSAPSAAATAGPLYMQSCEASGMVMSGVLLSQLTASSWRLVIRDLAV